ncbi:MAG: hypothetical protein ACRERV_07720 [Methylococcales bacterium]
MKKKVEDPPPPQPAVSESYEMAKVIPIRMETVLSQYPIHKLSKDKKPVQIRFTTEGKRGRVETAWEVSANAKYGHPGELAYKLDTLVINRLVDDLRPDVPEVIKIADSLRELSELIGKKKTGNTAEIKNALYQNAFAAITARLEFTGNDKTQRAFEFGSTRYGIVFIGERLPNGKTADAIYIVLNPLYRDVLRHAKTRPLDYAYLQELPPSAQRLYELIAPQIFSAIKNDNLRAKYLYSEFCQRSTLAHYHEWEKVKKQLYKIHRPHIQSGYIKAVDFEETTDAAGAIDWVMWYTPGRKAKAEFRRFNTKEGKELDKQQREQPRLVSGEFLPPAAFEALTIHDQNEEEESTLINRLVGEGVTGNVARELVREDAAECERQLDALPHRDRVKDTGAYLVRAIRDKYAMPPKMEETKRKEQEAEARKRENEAKQEQEQRRAQHESKFLPIYRTSYLWPQIEKIRHEKTETAKALRKALKTWEANSAGKPDAEDFKAAAIGHLIEKHPEIEILDFWQWDQSMNPMPFDFGSV